MKNNDQEEWSLEREIMQKVEERLQQQYPDSPIMIHLNVEEMYTIVQGLQLIVSQGASWGNREADLAKEMIEIFTPVLVEHNHPLYVRVPGWKPDNLEEGDAEND